MKRFKIKYLGGVSNMNYLHSDAVIRFVVPRDRGFFNSSEKIVEESMSNYKIAPTLLLFGEKSRMKLSKYIKDSRIFNTSDLNTNLFDKLLLKLNEVKNIHINGELFVFNPFVILASFRQKIVDKTSLIYDQLIEEKIANIYLQDKRRILSHNDLIFANILVTPQENLYLIDFEYSGLNHPYFDIFSFFSENRIDNLSLMKKMVEFILPGESKKVVSIYDDFSTFLDIFWYHWALFHFQSNNNPTFKLIAEEKYRSFKAHTC